MSISLYFIFTTTVQNDPENSQYNNTKPYFSGLKCFEVCGSDNNVKKTQYPSYHLIVAAYSIGIFTGYASLFLWNICCIGISIIYIWSRWDYFNYLVSGWPVLRTWAHRHFIPNFPSLRVSACVWLAIVVCDCFLYYYSSLLSEYI